MQSKVICAKRRALRQLQFAECGCFYKREYFSFGGLNTHVCLHVFVLNDI
jgi:hypothetical protein